MEEKRIRTRPEANTGKEHILVCLSTSPSNIRIIEAAGRMAEACGGRLTALYVETPSSRQLPEADYERLQRHIERARALGASLEQIRGVDVAYHIAEYARLNSVTKIIVGKSGRGSRRFPRRKSLTERIIAYASNVEVVIVPDRMADAGYMMRKRRPVKKLSVADTLKMTLSLVCVTSLSLLFYKFGFSDSNIITLYILGVLITSAVTEHITYSILASVLSVVIFNYFFTEPRYTLLAYDIGYPMTFVVMFLAALLTGTLASKLKDAARYSAEQAYRTSLLLETNQSLQKAADSEEIWQTTIEQLTKLTGRSIRRHDPKDPPGYNGYSVHFGEVCFGYLEISTFENDMDPYESSIVQSIIGECALALENKKNAVEKEQAAILAHNEQLRANLLRTISHDLRTPLTSISGNADMLISNADSFPEEKRQEMYLDIYDDSMWLIDLVENLLSVTRMVGEEVRLNRQTELLEDLVEEALQHLDRNAKEHTIRVEHRTELLMVKVDTKLIMQVLINLINNAIKYTSSGSVIRIVTERKHNMAMVHVSDNGPGIPDEQKEKIFDLFFAGERTISDSHRSMGLGLALCRSIVTAHGGQIFAGDSESGGACFTFTLPVEERIE